MNSESSDRRDLERATSEEPREPTRRLDSPSPQEMLEAVFELGREIHLEMDEQQVVGRFLGVLGRLFPGRLLAVRVFDPRSSDRAICSSVGGELRPGVEGERVTLKPSSVDKTRLKTALAESARIKLSDRWDSPFPGVASGFAIPLVASGELYGVLDVGYPLGLDEGGADEPAVLPIANQLSVALRNERLHRETTVLRDYQAKLIEHANALILGVDSGWRITVCNQALCRLTGFGRQELIGRDLRDWLPVDERPRLTKLFLHALSGRDMSAGSSDSIDVELVTRDGSRVRTVWSVAAISGRGRVQAVVAIGQDQTKLGELQSQVIQAEKLATLGQLAAGVVHELNNPLTSITVYAEYLLKKAEARAGQGDKGAETDVAKLERIADGARRIMAFARDLVQYAKPAGNQLEMIGVNAVVQKSLFFCEHLFERSGVVLSRALAEGLPMVYAVSGQLEQVVINLVTNAVHACDGSGSVLVETRLVEPEVVCISVADSGPGIAAADRERIFEPFFTTKSDGKGTGLGLSIVRNIVEQHRGTLRVGVSGDGGALFECLFPAGDPTAEKSGKGT